MKPIKDYPQGFWEVQDCRFPNKYHALLYATEVNAPVHFKFFNHVWENFDRKLLGTVGLKELYRQRAQQLRDKYDYLILYFSGGSDSYNILRTFIDNGIKVDEICVKWCSTVLDPDKNLYTPNTDDVTAYNYLSEWDYAIKPVLDEIAVSNPEIKIEIVDWLTPWLTKSPAELFKTVNHWHDIEIPSLAVWSPSETKLVAEGKTVGSIYGVDKPGVYFGKTEVFMYFTDACTAMGPPNPCNVYGTEFFYWTPELPALAFEMAYQTMLCFQNDPELASVKYSDNIREDGPAWQANYQIQQKQLRYKLYDNWTDRFQTQKPEKLDRSDKHSWIYSYPAAENYRTIYHKTADSYLEKIRKDMHKEKNGTKMYRSISTKGFLISKIG